jgi:serine/threonine protein kinase
LSVKIGRIIGHKIADRYCITGEIGVGGMGRVFRAISFDDPSRDVAIKVILRDRRLNSEDLLRFQKEASVMSRLHHQNIISFEELGLLSSEVNDDVSELGSGYYIVMEFANGRNLKEILLSEGRKDLDFFFDVGIQVASALDYTHGKNIIHRDIKPQNIVAGRSYQDQKNLTVKVLDFGVARLAEAMNFSGERGAFEEVAGTPMYMAPEQTSLMRAPIDHRVDLYSLGCVLYEVLAGRPPFSGGSRDKLARQHVNDEPEALQSLRPELPVIVANIVHKLLSKHPDQRYQTAFSVIADLQRAKLRLGRGESKALRFPLALNDRFQSVSARLQLVGRDKEMTALMDAYQSAANERRSRLTVVSGEAGVGKSRLLAEFRSFLAAKKVRFVSANFSKHENALQFNALANGINDYLIRILKAQPHEADEFRRKVKAMLGPTAHLVASVVPGLKPFIEDIPEAAEGESFDEFNFATFAKAFSDFTRCFADENSPVVFIFDDIHWADEQSLELIDQFFSHNNSQRFFMVLGHRPVQNMAETRFGRLVDKFRKLKRRFESIELSTFAPADVAAIVTNLLGDSTSPDQRLVTYIIEKTSANPLHVVELVRKLVTSDLITRVSAESGWEYDVELVSKANVLVDTIDLALSRVLRLNTNDRLILGQAAVIGLTFQFELLPPADGMTVMDVMGSLRRAIEEGLLVRAPDDPTLAQLGKTFAFSHHRVREAILQSVGREELLKFHQAVLQRRIQAKVDDTAKSKFALAHHLNQMIELSTNIGSESWEYGMRANFAAGTAAKEAEAFQAAQRYFECALKCRENVAKEKRGAIRSFDLYYALAEIDSAQRQYGTALKKLEEAAKHSANAEERLRIEVYSQRLRVFGGEISRAIESINGVLKKIARVEIVTSHWNVRWARFRFLIDRLIPISWRQHRLRQALKTLSRSGASKINPKYALVSQLMDQVSELELQSNPQRSMMWDDEIIRRIAAGQMDKAVGLRAVARRFSAMMNQKINQNSLVGIEFVRSIAKKAGLESVVGIVDFQKATHFDYIRFRYDDFLANLRRSHERLKRESYSLAPGHLLVLRMFDALMHAKFSEVERLSQKIPDSIATRNWLNPRAMSIYFFALLLAGKRDLLVAKVERYLERRRERRARASDVFVSMIDAMFAFARGDWDRVRQLYVGCHEVFVKTSREQFLLPFESDLLGLFLYTFPLIFEHEQRRRVLRDHEMARIFKAMQKRIEAMPEAGNPVLLLLKARSKEVLGGARVATDYDRCITVSKASGMSLIRMFAYGWFGDLLLRQGQGTRSAYLLKSLELSERVGAEAWSGLIRKLAEERNVKTSPSSAKVATGMHKSVVAKAKSANLAQEHLEHVVSVLRRDTALEEHIEESLAILARHITFTRPQVVLHGGVNAQGKLFFPFEASQADHELIQKVLPYMNIKSSLMVPIADLGSHLPVDSSTVVDTQLGLSQASSAESSAEEGTMVLSNAADENASTDVTSVLNIANDSESQVSTTATIGEQVRSVSLRLHALIPIRGSNGSLGLLCLEDVVLSNRDTTALRDAFDKFGTQLGIVFEQKLQTDAIVESNGFNPIKSFYRSGIIALESSSWLNIFAHGAMRAGRDSGWYLGVGLPGDQYLLLYTRINGVVERREFLSSLLWHQMIAFRAQVVNNGRRGLEISEVRDELESCLSSFPHMNELESVSLAFSLFDAKVNVVTSGHFGPSRPIVLGQDNRVMPQNDVVSTLLDGRDLRFWAVQAGLNSGQLYFLAHDTSRLESDSGSHIAQSIRSSLIDTTMNAEALHKIVQRVVPADILPRYYVCVSMKSAAEVVPLPRPLPKAE